MALAKDPKPYQGNFFRGSSSVQVSDQSSPQLHVLDEHHHRKAVTEAPSVINFKTGGYNNVMHNINNHESFLGLEINDQIFQNFITQEQDSHSSIWEDHQYGEEPFGWPNFEANAPAATATTIQEFGTQEACFNKRPHTGESKKVLKKQCTIAIRKTKQKSTSTTASKDPQSIAAKNRRERISERLKTLQELIPNGSKVDLVTMLVKAIGHVKFLQLQVKVLATDELWLVQGGKAPNLSQIKEAIDAILSSQKDTNSISK